MFTEIAGVFDELIKTVRPAKLAQADLYNWIIDRGDKHYVELQSELNELTKRHMFISAGVDIESKTITYNGCSGATITCKPHNVYVGPTTSTVEMTMLKEGIEMFKCLAVLGPKSSTFNVVMPETFVKWNNTSPKYGDSSVDIDNYSLFKFSLNDQGKLKHKAYYRFTQYSAEAFISVYRRTHECLSQVMSGLRRHYNEDEDRIEIGEYQYMVDERAAIDSHAAKFTFF